MDSRRFGQCIARLRIFTIMRYLLIVCLMLGVGLLTPIAQSNCSSAMEDAMSRATSFCDRMGINDVCYGNVSVFAEPIARNTGNFVFEAPGNIITFTNLQRLILSPLEDDIWGIVMMSLQANLPSSVPGQIVQIVVFGDTNLERPEWLVGRVDLGGFTYSQPSYEADSLFEVISRDAVRVSNRNEDSSWVYIVHQNGGGWIESAQIRVNGDIDSLPVAERGVTSLQAFSFTSGIGAGSCTDTLTDGLLVQTPRGDYRIDFSINGVDINLGSTAYLQNELQVDGTYLMRIALLEGSAVVRSLGQSVFVDSGQSAVVNLDTDLTPDTEPVVIDALPEGIETLPLNGLNRDISEELEQALTYESDRDDWLTPASGGWNTLWEAGEYGTYTTPSGQVNPTWVYTCTGSILDGNFVFHDDGYWYNLIVTDENNVEINYETSSNTYPLLRTGANTFVLAFQDTVSYVVMTLTIESPTTIRGVERRYKARGCILDMPFTSTLID